MHTEVVSAVGFIGLLLSLVVWNIICLVRRDRLHKELLERVEEEVSQLYLWIETLEEGSADA